MSENLRPKGLCNLRLLKFKYKSQSQVLKTWNQACSLQYLLDYFQLIAGQFLQLGFGQLIIAVQ